MLPPLHTSFFLTSLHLHATYISSISKTSGRIAVANAAIRERQPIRRLGSTPVSSDFVVESRTLHRSHNIITSSFTDVRQPLRWYLAQKNLTLSRVQVGEEVSGGAPRNFSQDGPGPLDVRDSIVRLRALLFLEDYAYNYPPCSLRPPHSTRLRGA